MRFPLAVVLVLALLPRVPAQDNEAEKLYRAMEKKITEAKAFKVAFTIETGRGTNRPGLSRLLRKVGLHRRAWMTGHDTERPGLFKGFLLLTKDNRARLKASGVDFGEVRRWEMVSNGKQVKFRPFIVSGVEGDKEEETVATPGNLHDHLAARICSWGVYPNLPRLAASVLGALGAKDPDQAVAVEGFKAGATEKVNGRDAKVVHYKLKGSQFKGDESTFTLWIDARTLLPLKHVSRLGRDWGTITETYQEFTLDLKFDPAVFDLIVGQVESAEKLVRAVEEKLQAANAVQVSVKIELKAIGKTGKGQASLLFTPANQARIKVEIDELGKHVTSEMIADGKRLKYAESPNTIAKAEADPVPAKLSRQLTQILSGPGVWLTYHDLNGAPAWDFKLVSFEAGAAEKVGGRDAKVVHYIVAGLPGTDWDVTLWIDAETGLPLKRVVSPIGGEPGSITETYTFTPKPQIPAGSFELAK
jgi:outer membrane lipoprotein-sorting protein